ncbi:hypothetical protein BN7_1441 [Wickerhamomyces ciferrii]|uniref:Uncharacterized protein n=1 Tax=Wickerhamomyces ciferrii (strain ATCC 14091 / BCRC 22168 / CBS 111 / JCM 3599 / NBRC 0793 / NRRL Y-1031 F-60-10) TaxID=1206466 RepID=K0KIA9_WICCF|nr:uncharacterized protein BN7_1441 [Wickerhamomyces ciferrii]CCH41902.1 hypothetical protein BN7_1441 [Wickerhamomyces ciferrii]
MESGTVESTSSILETNNNNESSNSNQDSGSIQFQSLPALFLRSKQKSLKNRFKSVKVSDKTPSIINSSSEEQESSSSTSPITDQSTERRLPFSSITSPRVTSSSSSSSLPTPPPENQINFLGLPPEILKMIIYHVYLSKSSIIPIVTCCREIYETFAYLIYMTKVVSINNDLRLFKDGGLSAYKTLDFIDRNQSNVATQITVLTMKSTLSHTNIRSENNLLSINSKLFLKLLPKMRNLVVLTIESDEHQLLFQSLCHLPEHLQVLRLYFKLTQRHLSKIDGPILKDDQLKNLSHVKNLQFIDFDFKKTAIDNVQHRHPELGDHELFNNHASHLIIRPVIRSGIGNLINYIKGKDTTSITKSNIGKIFYEFMLKNRHELIKVEFAGIDMNLILSRTSHLFPFNFPKLRMLFFDTITRETLSDWIPMFEEVNKSQTYRNKLPLMVYYDRLSQRIYYKDTRYQNDPESDRPKDPCDLKNWEYSEQVAAAYAILNQKRNIKY